MLSVAYLFSQLKLKNIMPKQKHQEINRLESHAINEFLIVRKSLVALSKLNGKSLSENLEDIILLCHNRHGCRNAVKIKGELL